MAKFYNRLFKIIIIVIRKIMIMLKKNLIMTKNLFLEHKLLNHNPVAFDRSVLVLKTEINTQI